MAPGCDTAEEEEEEEEKRKLVTVIPEHDSAALDPNSAAVKSLVIVVDGSVLEGGGQVCRTASVLAALWGKRLRLHSIRGKRTKPGLRPQHLKGLEWVKNFCGGDMKGLEVGSCEVQYVPPSSPPSSLAGGGREEDCCFPLEHKMEVSTAGSCTLMLQSALPCLVASLLAARDDEREREREKEKKKKQKTEQQVEEEEEEEEEEEDAQQNRNRRRQVLRLVGGTDVPHSPLADYARLVLAPNLKTLLGIDLKVEVIRRGFYPRGGGEMLVEVELSDDAHDAAAEAAAATPAIDREHGDDDEKKKTEIKSFHAVVVSGGNKITPGKRKALARTIAKAAREVLLLEGEKEGEGASSSSSSSTACCFEESLLHDEKSKSPGLGFVLVAKTWDGRILGGSCILEPKHDWKHAVEKELSHISQSIQSGARFDQHMSDQVLLLVALFKRKHFTCASPATLHTKTAATLINRMLGKDIFRF